MWPAVISIGPIYISIFGISLAAGFLVASFFLFRAVKNDLDITPEDVFDACMLIMLGSIIGARIWYIFFHSDIFEGNILLYILFRERPGLSFAGGLIGGFFSLLAFRLLRRISFWRLLEYGTIPFLFGYLFGQIGSLFDGFNYGSPTTLPWGVALFGSSDRYLPLPLYQVLFTIFLLFLARFTYASRKKKEWRVGSWFLIFLGMICLFSAFLAFWRSDLPTVNTLRIEQLFLFSVGIFALFAAYVRTKTVGFTWQSILAFGAKIRHNIERHEVSKNNT